MKIRTGFVSNSSSSSFLISFDKLPSTKEELAKLLSIEEKLFIYNDDDVSYLRDNIIDIIFNDIQNAKPLSFKEFKEFIHIDDEREFMNIEKYITPDELFEYNFIKEEMFKVSSDHRIKYSDYRSTCKEATKFYLRILEKNISNDVNYLILEYGNENGDLSSFIEYSNIFDNILIHYQNNH
jgi:hypothetical protein